MTYYPQETIDKASALLCISLRYLFLELELYYDVSRQQEEFTYTNELSVLFQRVKECLVQAEVVDDRKVLDVLYGVEEVLTDLRTNFDEVGSIKLYAMDIKELVDNMERNPIPTISMKEYREK